MSDPVSSVEELIREAGTIRNSNPERSIKLLEEGLSLAEQAGDLVLQVRCKLGIGLTYQNASRFPEALDHIGKAMDLALRSGNEQSVSDCSTGLGNVYFYLGDHDRSLKYHMEALKIREKGKDPSRHATSINSLGVVYATMKNYPLAEEYFLKSLEMNKRLNHVFGMKMAMNNIGLAALEQKKFEKAIQTLRAALPGAEDLQNDTILLEILTNLGDAYREAGKLEEAELHLRRAEKILKGRNNVPEARLLLSLAAWNHAKGNATEAREICADVIRRFSALGLKESECRGWKLMGEIGFASGDSRLVKDAMDRYILLNEEIHREELQKKTKNLALIYEAESLRKENEIHYLRNVELKKAYADIGAANQNLTDSIQYARHIQEVIFQKHVIGFRTHFPSSFLLSIPKDIVSGDFLWFHQAGDKMITAVADCTGHGVPGAFLSLLGHDLLNKAVIERGITAPDRILEHLHLALREFFPEKEEAPKQGMDLMVTVLKKGRELSWAGARGTGLLLREGEFAQEMNGDRVFLGGTTSHEFSLWEAECEKGDKIFLFTDGFADQKGKGGKLGRKALKSVLESDRPIRSREEQLGTYFEKWKGEERQVDDVTVAGWEIP